MHGYIALGGAAIAGRLALLLGLTLCLGGYTTPLQAQAPCHVVLVPESHGALMSLVHEAQSCTVEAGGLVYDDATYKIHYQAETAGSCQRRYIFLGTCILGTIQPNPQPRVLGTTWVTDVTQKDTRSIMPNNFTTIQNYSTVGPTNTASSGLTWSPGSVGTHTIISNTAATPTSCDFTPTSFAADPIVVHSLSCEPNWNDDNPYDVVTHVAPAAIKIYTPLDGNDILKAIGEVGEDWETVADVEDLTFEVSETPCGTGTDCITIEEDENLSGCGAAASDYNTVTGIKQNMRIYLPSDWDEWSYDALKWALAHELGHHMGLDNHEVGENECPLADTIMYSPFLCGASENPAVKPNNYLAVKHGVFGGMRSTCGF